MQAASLPECRLGRPACARMASRQSREALHCIQLSNQTSCAAPGLTVCASRSGLASDLALHACVPCPAATILISTRHDAARSLLIADLRKAMQGKTWNESKRIDLAAADDLRAQQQSYFVDFIAAQWRCKAKSSSSNTLAHLQTALAILMSRMRAHLCLSSIWCRLTPKMCKRPC